MHKHLFVTAVSPPRHRSPPASLLSVKIGTPFAPKLHPAEGFNGQKLDAGTDSGVFAAFHWNLGYLNQRINASTS